MAEQKTPKLQEDPDNEGWFLDENGVSYRSVASWVFSQLLGGCGCGQSDELAARAVAIIEHLGIEHEQRQEDFFDFMRDEERLSADEVLLHWMASKEITEHGGTVYGSWLSDLGRQVLANTGRAEAGG
jgi:hypothetical protein